MAKRARSRGRPMREAASLRVHGVTILRRLTILTSAMENLGMQETPCIHLTRMSSEEYAAYSQVLGRRAIQANGILWNPVRPFFFRPLLPFREYSPDSVRAPRSSMLGGYQHAVPEGVSANSRLGVRIFDKAGEYSLKSLDYTRRRQVKCASEHHVIRPFDDVNEFKRKAYTVYRSFYERTHYKTGTERRSQAGFARWADSLFLIPKIVVLGGYRGDSLGGVSVSMWVEDTVVYSAFFCDNESLRFHIADLMLHAVREAAANCPDVTQLYAGMCSGERGLDSFYALRGCRLVRKPASIRLNPLAKAVLRFGLPRLYGKLLGR